MPEASLFCSSLSNRSRNQPEEKIALTEIAACRDQQIALLGRFGDCKPLRESVWELRVDWCAGYQVDIPLLNPNRMLKAFYQMRQAGGGLRKSFHAATYCLHASIVGLCDDTDLLHTFGHIVRRTNLF